MLDTDRHALIPNTESFVCPVCFDEIEPGDGVVLRECLHHFCKACISGAIQHAEEAGVKCPYQDDNYSCNEIIQEREIRDLVPQAIYEKFLQRSLSTAEGQAGNSYHCKTTDCTGWCIYEDAVNFFQCEVCNKVNCLTCKVIHEGRNCKQYQDMINDRARIDVEVRETQRTMEALVASGEARPCPKCQVIIQKKGGCDHMKCSMCQLDFSWAKSGGREGQ